jgi:UDP-glucose 6-dehydrogenase
MSKLFMDYNMPNSLSEVTSKMNKDYTNFLIRKIGNLIKKTDVIGVLGISYKLGTPVIDESPGVSIAIALFNQGMIVNSWDDENAEVPVKSIPSLSLDEILNACDFFVITRETREMQKIKDYLKFNKKRFIDLWDHSK